MEKQPDVTEIIKTALSILNKDDKTSEAAILEATAADAWALRLHVICKWIWKVSLGIGGTIDLGLFIFYLSTM